ncbi:YceI family protein [uncultured Roseobacter sp.]|uniref:YceI family protein n=1 Tax=uncultured Roseobacter sp. TaxID=114847 RepID=UPI0026046358|nr:YceI family protein [uncultured Roseobacter sp.]
MRIILATTLVTALALPAFAETRTFKTDAGHTEVRFGWDHAGVTRQHGEFDRAGGTLSIDLDDPTSATLEVTIDAASVSTGFGPLDDHIKNADFLKVDEHPNIQFVSNSITRTGETTADVAGDVTLRGVTVPATLKVELIHQGKHPVAQFLDYYKGDWLGFHASAEIDTTPFGFALPVGTLAFDISTEMKAE